MKKSILALIVAVVAIPVASITILSGCSTIKGQESAAQYATDTTITARVKADLAADPELKNADISVTTMKDHVDLTGYVLTKHQKHRAVAIAHHVKGVKSVKDQLVVKGHHHRHHR